MPQNARRVLDQYRQRWRIEEWHRIFKTGCRAEFLHHDEAQRLERTLTIKAVIAGPLFTFARLGHDTSELSTNMVFDDTEITALSDFAGDRQLDESPITLGGAVRIMAILDIDRNRRNDPPPGPAYMWRGHATLTAQAEVHERLYQRGMFDRHRPPHQKLRSDKTCD